MLNNHGPPQQEEEEENKEGKINCTKGIGQDPDSLLCSNLFLLWCNVAITKPFQQTNATNKRKRRKQIIATAEARLVCYLAGLRTVSRFTYS